MEKLHKMIAQADVFLTNNRTKALQKMGLDYDSLKDKYPRLVMATLSGYGEKGALKDAPGFDLVAMFQETGFSRDLMVATDHTTYPANSAYGFGDIAASLDTLTQNTVRTGDDIQGLLDQAESSISGYLDEYAE